MKDGGHEVGSDVESRSKDAGCALGATPDTSNGCLDNGCLNPKP